MAAYSIEVEPILVTELTGRLGAALATYRGHEYRVTLGGRGITRDGAPIEARDVPAAVYKFATQQYDMLCKAYMHRKAA